MFFDCAVFDYFVSRCRAIGISVPIIPGIMCVLNYGGFKRMTVMCKTRVPKELSARAAAVKDDEEAFKSFSIQLGTEMVTHLTASGVPGLHFYTLNTSAVTQGILEATGLNRPAVANVLPN